MPSAIAVVSCSSSLQFFCRVVLCCSSFVVLALLPLPFIARGRWHRQGGLECHRLNYERSIETQGWLLRSTEKMTRRFDSAGKQLFDELSMNKNGCSSRPLRLPIPLPLLGWLPLPLQLPLKSGGLPFVIRHASPSFAPPVIHCCCVHLCRSLPSPCVRRSVRRFPIPFDSSLMVIACAAVRSSLRVGVAKVACSCVLRAIA